MAATTAALPGLGDQSAVIAQAAIAAYDLPAPRLTLVRSTNNALFKVECGEQAYALRVHRPSYRSVAHTGSELLYLSSLRRDTGLAVPQPIHTRAGELLAIVDAPDGPRHCDLLAWLPGQVRRPGQGFGPRSAHQLGAALGTMHGYAERYQPPAGFELPRWDADGLFTSASPYHPGALDDLFAPADRAAFAAVAARTRALFAALGSGREQFGIIHADVILGNCLLHRRAPQLLDFDDCGWGFFVYDLCPLLGNFKDYPNERALRTAFLAGYRSQRELPRDLEAQFGLLIAARHATSCLWAAGRWRDEPARAAEHIAHRMVEVRAYLAGALVLPTA